MDIRTPEKDTPGWDLNAPFLSLKDEQLRLEQQVESWGETLSSFPLNRLLQVELLRDSPITLLNDSGEQLVQAKKTVSQLLQPFRDGQAQDTESLRKLYKELDHEFQNLYLGFRARAEGALRRVTPADIVDPSVVTRFKEFYLSEAQKLPTWLRVVVSKKDGIRVSPGSTIGRAEGAASNGATSRSGLNIRGRFRRFFYRLRLERRYRVIRVPLQTLVERALSPGGRLGLEVLIDQYQTQHAQALLHLEDSWKPVRLAFQSTLAEINERLRADEETQREDIDFTHVQHGVATALDQAHENIDLLSNPYHNLRRELPQAIQQSHEHLLSSIPQFIDEEALPVSAIGRIKRKTLSTAWYYRVNVGRGVSTLVVYGKWIRESGIPKAKAAVVAVRATLALTSRPQEKLLTLADLPDYTDVLRYAYTVYPILSEVYSPEPLSTAEFVVSRERELATLREALSRWQTGYLSSVGIVGAQGSGKTTLLNTFTDEIESEHHVVRFEIKNRLKDENDTVKFLRDIFQVPESYQSLDQVIEYLLTLPRQIVMLEGGHNIMLRTVGGRRAPQAFLYVMMATRSRLLWIFSCREFPWSQLDYLVGISRYFTHEVHIARTDASDLRNVILRRQISVGLPIIFLEDETRAQGIQHLGFGKDGTDEVTQRERREKYFQDLSELTGGNIQAALYFWLLSLSHDDTKQEIEAAPSMRINARVIEGLDRLYLFTLAELLKHGELTPEEHGQIFMMGDVRSRLTLNYLVQLRLVDPLRTEGSARPYAYEVSNVLIHIIASTLRSMNILF